MQTVAAAGCSSPATYNNDKRGFILFIIGTTAVGKTKLSLSIGSAFNGEIVSCDSMQVYKGCDVMTAKVTPQERSQVPHHMIDVLELGTQNYNRNQYYHEASQCVHHIQEDLSKFAIVVGGTHYYTEALMFAQPIRAHNAHKRLWENDAINNECHSLSSEDKYKLLCEIDPLLTQKLHPHNMKRIDSYYRQYLESQQRPSQHMLNLDEIGLRNENCLIFWPRCVNKKCLNEFQLKRIREMIDTGGLEEACALFDKLLPENLQNSQEFSAKQAEKDEEKREKNTSQEGRKAQKVNKVTKEEQNRSQEQGALQSIGYKELLPFYYYYKSSQQQQHFSSVKEARESEKGKELLEKCIQRLYFNTIHFRRRQVQWITNRIVNNCEGRQMKKRLYIFEFKDYNSQHYNESVLSPANSIIETYFTHIRDGMKSVEEALNLTAEKHHVYLIKEEEIATYRARHVAKALGQYASQHCETCDIELKGGDIVTEHMSSKKHAKKIEKLKQKEKLKKFLQERQSLK